MIPVIFDLDGTLIDSAPDIHRVANMVLGTEDLPPLPFEQVRSFIGNGVSVLIDRILEAQGITDDPARKARMLAAFAEAYETSHELTTLYPGALAALERLAAAGHPLGLCTNKPYGPTRAVLRHFGIEDAFAAVVGGDTLAERKPHPAPLLHTLTLMGGTQALFVGDSEVDAETAAAAQMPFLLFTEGYRKTPVDALPHAARFDHHDELSGLVSAFVKAA